MLELTYQNSKPLHKSCYNAKHSLQRMALVDPTLKEAVIKLQQADPDKYHAVLMSLRTAANRTRSAKVREDAKRFVTTMSAEVKVTRSKGVMMLPERQYVAWHVHNELMTKGEATEKWRADVAGGQVYSEEDDGVICLAVKLPTKITGEALALCIKRACGRS